MSVEAGLDLGHADDQDIVAAAPAASVLRDRLMAAGKSWSVRAVAILVGIALWYWAARVHLQFYIRFDNIPSPVTVAEAFWKHVHELTFYIHIAVSLERILCGYAIAAAVGIILGLIMGRSRLARDF